MKRIWLVSALLLVVPCFVFAQTLPDTGQTKCYDAAGNEIIPCPPEGSAFSGQDANFVPCNPHSYTSLSGGIIVLDNVTGLMWENKTDDGSIHDKDNKYDGNGSQNFIATLNSQNFGGFSDWRLPTIIELTTLVDNSRINPSINTDYFPNTMSYRYWSSTSMVNAYNYAWYIDFSTSTLGTYSRSLDGGSVNCVRAVRGGQ